MAKLSFSICFSSIPIPAALLLGIRVGADERSIKTTSNRQAGGLSLSRRRLVTFMEGSSCIVCSNRLSVINICGGCYLVTDFMPETAGQSKKLKHCHVFKYLIQRRTTGLPTKHHSIKQRDVCLSSSPKKGKKANEDPHGRVSKGRGF